MSDIQLHLGDCLEVMAGMEPGSVDTIITDPPYGLEFMGKEWDNGVPGIPFWEAALRVAKPGAMLLAMGGSRTHHRLACAIEDAGWEIRDCINYLHDGSQPKAAFWNSLDDEQRQAYLELHYPNQTMFWGYGQGFPKSANISKNIESSITAPATPDAVTWDGWGTALKPAYEPIIVAMKPLDGTFAENALKHGVAGLWIDGGRVGTEDKLQSLDGSFSFSGSGGANETGKHITMRDAGEGRWPANLILDGSASVVRLFPQTVDGGNRNGKSGNSAWFTGHKDTGQEWMRDNGSAARFFYCAKASRRERNSGLDSTCTVKYNIPKSIIQEGISCQDVSTALVESLRRATSELTIQWLIGESGANITGLCPRDSLSTTLTEISRITPSKILSLWTRSPTSESTAGVSCETVSGGSPAVSAESSSPSTKSTGICQKRDGPSTDAVRSVISSALSLISEEENWQELTNIHSTVKPLALVEYLCNLTKTPSGGVVLDPFVGSGTTMVACVNTGRDGIGIDTSDEYIDIAQRRVAHAEAQAQLRLL